jgi:hypothetical protein
VTTQKRNRTEDGQRVCVTSLLGKIYLLNESGALVWKLYYGARANNFLF